MTAVPAATAPDAAQAAGAIDVSAPPTAPPAAPPAVRSVPVLRPLRPAVRLPIPAALRGLAALDALVVFGLTAVALATRLLALRWSAGLNSDEAIPGLMALHVLTTGDHPIFFWGQHYFGSLEVYFIAALFRVLGFQPWLVFVPPTVASLALVPLTAALGRWLSGNRGVLAGKAAGWLAALPVAAATPVMARMLAHAGGGFSLAYALQGAAIYCHLRALTGQTTRGRRVIWALLFALTSGFLCWVWQPSLALTAVLLLILLARRPELLWAATLPLLVGLAPPLYYNATQHWPTVAEILRKTSTPPEQAPAEITSSRWVYAILLGMAFGGGEDTYSIGTNWPQALAVAASVAFVLLVVFATGLLSAVKRVWHLLRRRPAAPPRFGPDRTVAAVLAIAIATNVAAAHGAVRHLHSAALLAFPFFGALPAALLGASRSTRGVRAFVSLALAAAVLIPNAWFLPRAEGVYGDRPRFGSVVEEVVAGLTERGLTYGYADYWTAYPITYWSGETIVVSPVAPMTYGGHFERYPEFTALVKRQPSFSNQFLLLETQCDMRPYAVPVTDVGGTYRIDPLGPYNVLWDLHVPTAVEPDTLQRWRTLIESKESC